MEEARRFDHPARRETLPVKRAKFGTKFLDAQAQVVGVALVHSFGNQPGKQDLSVVQGGRQFGQPAGAARGPQYGYVIHGLSLSWPGLLAFIIKLRFGGILG
jgi:hypothetical protein